MEAVNPDSSEEVRNWTELPPEVMLLILAKLDIVEILRSAQIVCSSWRKLCKEPQIWRSIDMRNMRDYEKLVLEKIARLAVDRSCGQLVEFSVGRFGSEELLQYITDKSSPLRCLRLVFCDSISDEGLIKVARNLPLLEELQLCNCSFSKEAVEAVGRSCPLLKSFRLNYSGFNSHIECDEEAVSIAENMPELRHLHLYGNKLTNDGLQAILDGCPHLESLDLRHCFNVKLEGDLGRRCADRIRYLRPPNDTTDDYEYDDDYEFDAELYEDGSFDEEYQSGFSDFDFHLYDENYEYYEFSDGSDLSDPGDFGFGILP